MKLLTGVTTALVFGCTAAALPGHAIRDRITIEQVDVKISGTYIKIIENTIQLFEDDTLVYEDTLPSTCDLHTAKYLDHVTFNQTSRRYVMFLGNNNKSIGAGCGQITNNLADILLEYDSGVSAAILYEQTQMAIPLNKQLPICNDETSK